MRRLACAALALWLPACSSILGIQSVVENTSETADASMTQCGVAPTFGLLSAADGVAGSSVMVENDGSIFMGLLLNVDVKKDLFALWLRPGFGALAGGYTPGHYDISGAETSLATCGICAFIATDFDGTTFTARDFYFANAGTIDLTQAKPKLIATLRDLKFRHIDLTSGQVLDECKSQIQQVETNLTVVEGGTPDAGVPDAPLPPDARVVPDAAPGQPDAAPGQPDAAGPPTTGSAIDTYISEGGELTRPFDLSGTTVEVLVPNGAGYDIYPGKGKADGSFSVANAPSGPRWVHVGASYLATNAESGLDFGSNYLGRGDYNTTVDQDKFSVDLTNAETGQTGDFFEVYSWNINGAFSFDADPGSNELATDMWFSRAIEGDKGDRVYVTELALATSALSQQYAALTRYIKLPQFSTTTGQTFALAPAPFSLVPQSNSAVIDWRRSTFQGVRPNVNPSAVYSDDALYIFVMPGGNKLDLGQSAAPDLLFVGRNGLGDTNVGTVNYGNPFGAPFQRFTWVVERHVVNYTAPGATNALGVYGYLSRTDPVTILSSPVGISLTPVLNPRINSQDAFVARTGVGATPTLSWGPPITGAPTGYIVTIDELTNEVGDTASSYVAFLYTSNTQMKLPPNLLVAGHTYYARITAFFAPNTNIAKAPYRRGTPNAFSDVLTATFSP
jgi:hypothetical protein